MSEGYIQVKGGKVWYSICGQEKKNIPLVLLHGGPGAPHYYLEPLETLSDERPVILYDQLGCGKSDRPHDKSMWTVEHFIEELDEMRKKFDLKKLHLLGQSWGTMLAVEYMLTRNPQGVMSLVLSAPCLSASRWRNDCRRYISEMSERDRNIIMDCETTGHFDSVKYKNTMDVFYKHHLCRLDPWPDCITKTFENMGTDIYEYMWGPSEFTMTGTLKNYERANQLKEIKIPTLFTCGRYDEASPESTEYYHRMMPSSELIIFEDASHMHHIEQQKLYLDTIRAFINRAQNR